MVSVLRRTAEAMHKEVVPRYIALHRHERALPTSCLFSAAGARGKPNGGFMVTFETRSVALNYCSLRRSGRMCFLVSPLLRAIFSVFSSDEDLEGGGVDAIYIVVTFFVLGIWIVFRRYENIQTRAVDFEWPAPEVRCSILTPTTCSHVGNQAAHPAWQSIAIHSPSLLSHEDDPGLRPPIYFPERNYITCFDPSNGLHLATLPADNAFEIGQKISQAGRAQKAWRKSDWGQRRKVVHSLLKWLVENRE
jgi:Aldehyde dehydrogenase family